MDKQHILDEIKRTALANGGAALGKQRFFRETGIKDSDWYGKHWIRWGDALTEAGFAPNRMNSAYDETLLIRKLVEFTRELGRFPLFGELRLKARNDANFPSHNVFDRIAPTKEQRVSKVMAYCREHGGFDDVIAVCAEVARLEEPQPENSRREGDDLGFVYLLRSGRFFKIGRSNAAGRRERELAIQLPEKATIVHEIRTDDPPGIEAYWHRRFGAKRKNGEWFELDAADVKAFRRRKFM